MLPILKTFLDLFNTEKTTYSHRNRTIEMIASEKGIDIDLIRQETKAIMENQGNIEAIVRLRKRFHVTSSAAWRFVDELDMK